MASPVRAPACGRLPVEHGDFIRQVLERVGDKWTLLVIANLKDGARRYSHLQQLVPGISQRMLTPLGESLLDTATALVDWATANHGAISAHRARSRG